MFKKPKKVKVKKEVKPKVPEMPVKEVKKESVKETIAAKAKRLSKGGSTAKEVAKELGINKYEASELIKGK